MIYCVDDDNTIRDIEVYTLEQTGFKALGLNSGASLFEALEIEIPDLIVLDIMMPGDDGIETLKKLRATDKYKGIPVIMATAKGTETDKISGLNLGADDYLVKPFGMMEMVARINAVLRRTGKNGKNEIEIGDITLNEEKHIVIANGKNIDLTNKEFAMLALFMNNKDMVFNRDKLMREVWGQDFIGESRTVDMHIKTLRKKLGEAGGQIKTVIGIGYRIEDKL